MRQSDTIRELIAAQLGAGEKVSTVSARHSVDQSRIRDWLNDDPEFIAMVLRYKQEIIDSIVGEVAAILPEAVLALKRNLSCGSPHAEVRAALGLLSAFLRIREGAEVSDRVAKLESLLKGEEAEA